MRAPWRPRVCSHERSARRSACGRSTDPDQRGPGAATSRYLAAAWSLPWRPRPISPSCRGECTPNGWTNRWTICGVFQSGCSYMAFELAYLPKRYPQRDSNPCCHLERSDRHVQQLRSNTIGPGQRPTCFQGWGLCPSKSSEWMGNWMDSGFPKSIPSYGPSFGESAAVTLLGLRAILSIGKPSEA
jgi:hypothetical protein